MGLNKSFQWFAGLFGYWYINGSAGFNGSWQISSGLRGSCYHKGSKQVSAGLGGSR